MGLLVPATSAAFSSFSGASSDGSRVFFISDEQLVSGDTDGSVDVYERSGGTTSQVSEGEINGDGAVAAFFVGASSDGSKVFFGTDEPLASGDTDTSRDLYERSGGTTTHLSQGEINGDGAFFTAFAGASNDGSKVFFVTDEQLVSGDTDSSQDLYERSGGTTTHVSQGEINGNGESVAGPQGASGDGSRVFFGTAEQLVSGDTDGAVDIYERSGGTTTHVSQGEINGDGAFGTVIVGVSNDGSKVFFHTNEQLVSGDTDSLALDIYERSGGTTTRVTQGEVNGNGDFDAVFAGASSDGSTVFFHTGEQLVSGDETEGWEDVYARSGGTTSHVSQGQVNGNGPFNALLLGASSDGSKAFFRTDEPLVSGDTDTSRDVYERSGGTTTRVSQGQVNGNGTLEADFYDASGDGSRVFFATQEQLVSGDTDTSLDIYERSGGTTTRASQGQINGNGAFPTSFGGISSDGSRVFFNTEEQLVSADADGEVDAYERSAGTTKLVSVDQKPPQTVISAPSRTNDPTPTFTFSTIPSEPGVSFECRVDGGSYSPCTSPKTTAHLTDGTHAFYVRATDAAGNVGPPAVRPFVLRTAEVSVSGSTLLVRAAPGAKDNLSITRSGSMLRISDIPSPPYTGSGVHVGEGCIRNGDYTASCGASGITQIRVVSSDRPDRVVNSTAIQGHLSGGSADDVLTGGSSNDILIGRTGADAMTGMNGNDQLRARDGASDTTINCDGGSTPGTADKAELDPLPNDPNSVVTGCETKQRN